MSAGTHGYFLVFCRLTIRTASRVDGDGRCPPYVLHKLMYRVVEVGVKIGLGFICVVLDFRMVCVDRLRVVFPIASLQTRRTP